MSDRIAGSVVLCPGQGAQHVGMARGWLQQSAAARKVFADAEAVLKIDLAKVCVEGPAEMLNRTDITQPAIYAISVAAYRALQEQGRMPAVGATAGLSLGEFTALHLAGALDFAGGLILLKARGLAMQEAAEARPGSMVALTGADEQQAQALCAQAAQGDVLAPANYNAPGQIVISGDAAACQRAAELAPSMGLRATPLTVAGAFHSPLMAPAAAKLAAALDQAAWSAPKVTVMSNVTAEPHRPDVASIKARLVEQLTHPVRWSQSMQWLIGHGAGEATVMELAPGRVLSGLMKRIDRQVRVQNHAEPA